MKKTIFFYGLVVAGTIWSAPQFRPFAPGEVTVGGEIGRRMQISAEKLMRGIDIDGVFFRGFRERKEKPDMWGGFSGWGMALDAIVKAAAHGIGGEEMVRFKNHWLDETISVQAADGSISMFSGKPGVWDNHEQAYLIQAFCYDHRHAGNVRSLAAARRLGDYLIQRQTKVNLGLETAFVMLYEETGDVRYVDYCRDHFKIEEDNDAYDRVLPVNGVVHVYTWIQRALAQMQYAAATGRTSPTLGAASDELFRRAFGNWLSISGSISGGSTWGEVWDDTQIGLGKWGETCATAYLMRALAERMKLKPEVRYGDLYERALYNAFFGAQSHDGKRQRYFIPFNERGEWFERETYCCPNNLRRMMFELPDAVFFATDDGFAVNLYAPAKLRHPGLEAEMTTEYPQTGKVSLRLKAAKAGRLRLRVPGWTALPDAGKWRMIDYAAGERTIEWELPMSVRLVRGRVAQGGKVAVMRGPVVYAFASTEKGWRGFLDACSIDSTHTLVWNGEGVALTLRDRKVDDSDTRPAVFLPFSSESRERTYFPLVGPGRSVEDELFQGCVTAGKQPEFEDPYDLNRPNCRIAVIAACDSEELSRKIFHRAEIVPFEEMRPAVWQLLAGKVDGLVFDEHVLRLVQWKYPERFRILEEPIDTDPSVIAVSARRPDVLRQLNDFIVWTRESGLYDEMFLRWCHDPERRPEDVPDISRVICRDPQARPLRVGIDPVQEPNAYFDRNGRLAGYDIEYILRFGRREQYRIEFVEDGEQELLRKLTAGELDVVIANLGKDPKRPGILWTRGYLDSDIKVLVREK